MINTPFGLIDTKQIDLEQLARMLKTDTSTARSLVAILGDSVALSKLSKNVVSLG
jgi:translation initiation factor 1 (eIF-1/SUI1)